MENQTVKINNFTITVNECKELISSTKPGLIEEIKKQMREYEDDLYYIDSINGQYFRFFSEDYDERMKPMIDVWDQKDLDGRSRSVLVCSCYEFEMRD